MTLRTRAPNRSRLLDLALATVLVAITFWRLVPAIDSTEFHRDEARWIGNSAILREWRNPFGSLWQDEGYRNRYGTYDESTRRRNQPPLAMYLIGFGMLLQGEGLPTTGYWIMNQDTRWNSDQGNLPSAAELEAGRRTNVVIAVLTVVALYILGTRLTNRVGGMAAALLYALHPLVRTTSTRAWSDPLLVLLIVLAGLAAVRLADRPTWGRAVVLGVVLGLGAATKLSPLAVAAALGVGGLTLWGIGRAGSTASARLRTLGLRLAGVPAIAALTFVAVYPYLWNNPVAHLYRMYAFRALTFDQQATGFTAAAVPNRGDAFRRIGHELGDRFSTSGFVAEELEQLLGHEIWVAIDHLDLVVAVFGLLLLLAFVVREGIASPTALAAAVVAGHALLIVLTMRVEFARYLLPVVLFVAVAFGIAVGVGWSWICSTTLGRWRG